MNARPLNKVQGQNILDKPRPKIRFPDFPIVYADIDCSVQVEYKREKRRIDRPLQQEEPAMDYQYKDSPVYRHRSTVDNVAFQVVTEHYALIENKSEEYTVLTKQPIAVEGVSFY